MSRVLRVAGAQLGAIQRDCSRASVVARMIDLLDRAKDRDCALVVYPELALTTFFPRWYIEDWAKLDGWFERAMPNPDVAPLFERAKDHGIGFSFGYAELIADANGQTLHRFNTSIIVDRAGAIVGKYRKVHLPGHSEHDPNLKWQHLEKRYFEPGDLGFPVWRTMDAVMGMCICNDRRWPETFRVMGLQGVELVMLGYNTPVLNRQSEESAELRLFHNHMSLQAGAYQNSTFVVGVAKAGREDGNNLMAGSAIVNPSGEIVALAETNEDELIVADCDFADCAFGKETIFNFAEHRRIEHYGLIASQTGAVPPPK